MSTIPNLDLIRNNLLTEFSVRIGTARGLFDFSRLWDEVAAAPLAAGAKTLLQERIATRLAAEREMGLEMKNAAKLKLALA